MTGCSCFEKRFEGRIRRQIYVASITVRKLRLVFKEFSGGREAASGDSQDQLQRAFSQLTKDGLVDSAVEKEFQAKTLELSRVPSKN